MKKYYCLFIMCILLVGAVHAGKECFYTMGSAKSYIDFSGYCAPVTTYYWEGNVIKEGTYELKTFEKNGYIWSEGARKYHDVSSGSVCNTYYNRYEICREQLCHADTSTICKPSAGIPTNYISNVNLDEINKDSGNGYDDFTNSDHTTLERGQTYEISVSYTSTQCSSSWEVPISVYIDWDGDGDLADETAVEVGQTCSSASAQITVPGYAADGPLLMRAIAGSYMDSGFCGPCGDDCTVTDVEDYSICLEGVNSCGNDVCDTGETNDNCPLDCEACVLSCTEDDDCGWNEACCDCVVSGPDSGGDCSYDQPVLCRCVNNQCSLADIGNCEDSDGGEYSGIKGRVTFLKNGIYETVDDECQGTSDNLYEYYCNDNEADDYHSYKVYSCNSGCQDGICIGGGTQECSETDDGLDYYEKGTTQGALASGGTVVIREDSCLSATSSILIEYVCTDNFVTYLTYVCPEGCQQGECIGTGPTDCTDSDGGKDYYVRGTTTNVPGLFGPSTAEDICYIDSVSPPEPGKENQLIEYYCEDYGYSEIYECPDGCQDGACIGGGDDKPGDYDGDEDVDGDDLAFFAYEFGKSIGLGHFSLGDNSNADKSDFDDDGDVDGDDLAIFAFNFGT